MLSVFSAACALENDIHGRADTPNHKYMKTFLMCAPRYFDVRYVINPWMAGNQGRVNRQLAGKQWEDLYNILSARASIRLIEPADDLPDMVFTANGGFISPTHDVMVSSFRHAERQGEAERFRKYFADAGYRIVTPADDVKFEGAGDALYESNGHVWAGYGFRSQEQVADVIATTFHLQVSGLNLIDPRWYHLDTAFCPLSNGFLIAYKKAFSTPSVDKIEHAFRDRIIWVSDEDANNFACNAVNIGNDIILHRASNALKAALKKINFNVIEVGVSEFIKAGGACKCLTLEL